MKSRVDWLSPDAPDQRDRYERYLSQQIKDQ
jgi:hypothetical protein